MFNLFGLNLSSKKRTMQEAVDLKAKGQASLLDKVYSVPRYAGELNKLPFESSSDLSNTVVADREWLGRSLICVATDEILEEKLRVSEV